MKITWPKTYITWQDGDVFNISVPFTWCLPGVREYLRFGTWKRVRLGGPAVNLMQPEFFRLMQESLPFPLEVGGDCPGVLQRFNPHATRTTAGCIRKCRFCAVPKTEGDFRELEDWPDGPVLCDNNLLAASDRHLNRVFDRLEKWKWADFNQGLDPRLLNEYHALRIKRVGRVVCRLALDHASEKEIWDRAYRFLRLARIPKKQIRSYVLVGYDTGPEEAWERCQWVKSYGVDPLPMWFHELDTMEKNAVTHYHQRLGWTDFERRRIMQWFYRRKVVKK